MSFNRRNFIRSASMLTALSLSELDLLAATDRLKTGGKIIAPDDEQYWTNARKLFPLTDKRAYLNNGTMGPSPYSVIEAIKAGMTKNDVDGEYNGYEKSKVALARFVNADKSEIALTHNVTEGINITCWGVPLKKRDEVIVTDHEHVGNALPWLNRQKLHGIKLVSFSPASTAAETLDRIESLITRKTRVIAIPHMPCTQGQIMPVKEVCKLARDKGIFSCIDGAHGPGMLPIDLHDMGCDTYASCGHKWMLGPKGTGFLYVRKDFQDTLQPYFVGGGSVSGEWDVTTSENYIPEYVDGAHRYFGGTQSLGHSKGLIAAVEFMEVIGMQNVFNRIKHLGKYTQDSLMRYSDKVELITPAEERSYCGINGFKLKKADFKQFNNHCYEHRVRIRAVPESGLNSFRVSTHIYNSKDEIDRLMEVIEEHA